MASVLITDIRDLAHKIKNLSYEDMMGLSHFLVAGYLCVERDVTKEEQTLMADQLCRWADETLVGTP